ncbi:MAG: RICIN domain-containing protein, partial [Ruminococcus sp.]|nr:RICIN domain-containing protein [Ruminococcus sp.]
MNHTEFVVNAAIPAYVTWRQTDSRWGAILLGSEADSTVANIGCAATSTCVLLAHSGVCSTDESVFNPKIGINALKNAGAFNSEGEISWGVVSKVYSDFKYVSRETLSGTNSDKLKQIQNYYDRGYYMIVSCNTNGGTSTNHWVGVRSCQNNNCTIIDTGGKNYTDLSKYTITNRVILYTAPKKSNENDDTTTYETMPSGTISLKNKSTGTYMTVDGGTASNGQNISVASKTSADAFKFNLSGGTSNYLASKLNTSYVVNPYSDNPGDGTNITLYTKDSSGTQTWQFEVVSGGYIIHSGYNTSCVLTVDGTNVKLATKTGKDSQVWLIEGFETY